MYLCKNSFWILLVISVLFLYYTARAFSMKLFYVEGQRLTQMMSLMTKLQFHQRVLLLMKLQFHRKVLWILMKLKFHLSVFLSNGTELQFCQFSIVLLHKKICSLTNNLQGVRGIDDGISIVFLHCRKKWAVGILFFFILPSYRLKMGPLGILKGEYEWIVFLFVLFNYC